MKRNGDKRNGDRDDEIIRDMETWLRETRPEAPPAIAGEVMRAIGARPRRRQLTWAAWILAPAALALVVSLLVRGSSPPSGPAAPGSDTSTAAYDASGDRVHCVFRFSADEAHEVCLVGSFNLWKVCDTPLVPAGDGTWTVTMDLPHGRYEYMFVVDGQWVTDPAAAQRIDDGFGRENALLLL